MPGKGTDIGFSSIDDEHSIVDSGSTTSGIETSDSHFMDKAQAVALEESEDHLTKVFIIIVITQSSTVSHQHELTRSIKIIKQHYTHKFFRLEL